MNRRPLEGMPNAPKLSEVSVTTAHVIEGREAVRQARERPCEFVVGVFQSAKVVSKSPSPDTGPRSVSIKSMVLDSPTYASSVALLNHESTLMIAACPDSPFEIASFHLSASYWPIPGSDSTSGIDRTVTN